MPMKQIIELQLQMKRAEIQQILNINNKQRQCIRYKTIFTSLRGKKLSRCRNKFLTSIKKLIQINYSDDRAKNNNQLQNGNRGYMQECRLINHESKAIIRKAMKIDYRYKLNFCKSGAKKLLEYIVQHDQLKVLYACKKQQKSNIYIKTLKKLEVIIHVYSVVTEVWDNHVPRDQFTKFNFDQYREDLCNRFLEPQNKYRIEAINQNNKNDKVENNRKLDSYQKLKQLFQ